MDEETSHYPTTHMPKRFGIWSELHERFMHNIDEPTKLKAWKVLNKLGIDKHRFQVKQIEG